MIVTIAGGSDRPLDDISMAAGTSYGKSDVSHKRVKTCIEAGHDSVLEHAWVTFRVEGISRACSHQLVRHRMASFVQKSQRYTKIDTSSGDWYVKPESFDSKEVWGTAIDGYSSSELFNFAMDECATNYNLAIRCGIKPEDARYLLPEATKTGITVTMNARELVHFLKLRMDKSAQWEIRQLANSMLDILKWHSDQWRQLMDWCLR